MSTPLVSVVIPTYNRAHMIGRTIENIFSQTYSAIDLIIVDDGSTDDTQAQLWHFRDRIRVITQANAGPAVARNRGAEAARGEIIAFQDSDDLWKPAKLERQVRLLTKYDRSVPCCLSNVLMSVVDGKERTSFEDSLIRPRHAEGLWLNVPDVLATRFVLFNQAVAIRRDAFERVGGFREDLKYLEDYDLPLRLSFEGPWAIIRDPLVIYGENSPESFSQQALKDPTALRECAVSIFEEVLTRVTSQGGQAGLRRLLSCRLSMLRRALVATRLKQSDSLGAQVTGKFLNSMDHYFLAAFRRSPWFPDVLTVPASDFVPARPGPLVRQP